jgi:hypothetical protein
LAIKGADLEVVPDSAGDKAGLRQLCGCDFDHRASCLFDAVDNKVAAGWISVGVPQLVVGYGIPLGVAYGK